jgi:hypothetical protein
MWIMVEPIAEIPFGIRQSPTRCYGCNKANLSPCVKNRSSGSAKNRDLSRLAARVNVTWKENQFQEAGRVSRSPPQYVAVLSEKTWCIRTILCPFRCRFRYLGQDIQIDEAIIWTHLHDWVFVITWPTNTKEKGEACVEAGRSFGSSAS